MRQIDDLLLQPHARVLVLCSTSYSARTLFLAYKRHAAKASPDLIFSQPALRVDSDDLDQQLRFYNVKSLKQTKAELAGLTFTNIVYSPAIGFQLSVLAHLKPWLRSPTYKGPFTIEPYLGEKY